MAGQAFSGRRRAGPVSARQSQVSRPVLRASCMPMAWAPTAKRCQTGTVQPSAGRLHRRRLSPAGAAEDPWSPARNSSARRRRRRRCRQDRHERRVALSEDQPWLSHRRFLLRGLFQGSAAVMALPFLDCFLDGNGQALAATGRPIPTRFGTFFWGCGLTKALYLPKSTGANYEDTPQLASLKPYKSKFNLLSGFRAYVDDKPNIQHWTGNAAITTGIAPGQRLRSSTPRPSTRPSPTPSARARASVHRGVLLRQQARKLFQPGRQQYQSAGNLSPRPLYPPVRPRIPGSLQGRLEARSGGHAAAKRAVGGGR